MNALLVRLRSSRAPQDATATIAGQRAAPRQSRHLDERSRAANPRARWRESGLSDSRATGMAARTRQAARDLECSPFGDSQRTVILNARRASLTTFSGRSRTSSLETGMRRHPIAAHSCITSLR